MHVTTPRNPLRSSPAHQVLGEDLRNALVAMVRKRVPESDVEDVVQATLAEAVESRHAPDDPEQLRRWIFGVARHKVVDLHRRRGRESFDVPEDLAEGPAPHAEADLLRWAEKRLPPGEEPQKTLEWMLREGDGEKLESIAESEKVPAPRVRQRVSRLRRHLKANWQREVALLAAVGVVITLAILVLRKPEPEPIAHDPKALPAEPEAARLRKEAFAACDAKAWFSCLEGLDAAKRLDPAGDQAPAVAAARRAAEKAIAVPESTPEETPPLPAPLEKKTKTDATPVPTTSPAPTPVPTFSAFPQKAVPTSAPPAPKAPTKPMGKKPSIDSDLWGSGMSGVDSEMKAPTPKKK